LDRSLQFRFAPRFRLVPQKLGFGRGYEGWGSFNHLLTSMKCLTLIRAIEADLAQGYAIVVQIVSTCEELLKRRLAEIPVEEWQDLNVDITPREYVMHYGVEMAKLQRDAI
jgi:hypothetical protein